MIIVCAGVLLKSGQVLLARRGPGMRHAGKWEFPGGRVEPGEAPAAALARELREELGIEAVVGPETARSRHTYDFGEIELIAFLVPKFSGELKPVEHDALAWVEARRLLEYDLTPADVPIAEIVSTHRRRQRYKGTHPRSFPEKYKELAQDAEAIAKAKERGSTPAGTHIPVMLQEVLAALEPLAGAKVLDCTLGWGGHAEELARRVGPGGSVTGLDKDGEELEQAERRLKALGLTILARRSDYADAKEALAALGVGAVDALLADLGVSSMQLDRPERGMSFKLDGPLDMRMDRSRGKTAAEWLASASESEIRDALARFGDEPDAEAIAAKLAALAAEGRAPKTTGELATAVSLAKGLGAARFRKKDAFARHPAARAFQALRIAVNSERASLAKLLSDLPSLVKPGGRAVFITFHAGEEALVEKAFAEQTAAGQWRAPLEAARKVSPEEARENPRARSARLWRAVRR